MNLSTALVVLAALFGCVSIGALIHAGIIPIDLVIWVILIIAAIVLTWAWFRHY